MDREELAKKILLSLLDKKGWPEDAASLDKLASHSYALADAVLRALKGAK